MSASWLLRAIGDRLSERLAGVAPCLQLLGRWLAPVASTGIVSSRPAVYWSRTACAQSGQSGCLTTGDKMLADEQSRSRLVLLDAAKELSCRAGLPVCQRAPRQGP